MGLLFYTVAAFGFAYIVGHARVSLRFRTWLDHHDNHSDLVLWGWFLALLECPACLGFWEGVLVAALVPAAVLEQLVPFTAPRPLAVLLLGLFTAGVGFILGRLTGLIKE